MKMFCSLMIFCFQQRQMILTVRQLDLLVAEGYRFDPRLLQTLCDRVPEQNTEPLIASDQLV